MCLYCAVLRCAAVYCPRGVGDLILVYKRVTNLASHTSRVSELLEQVRPPLAAGTRTGVSRRWSLSLPCLSLPDPYEGTLPLEQYGLGNDLDVLGVSLLSLEVPALSRALEALEALPPGRRGV